MEHVAWALPHLEEDWHVHFLRDGEWTLCGLAFEGTQRSIFPTGQGFKTVKKKVTCPVCIETVKECQKIKASEYIKI